MMEEIKHEKCNRCKCWRTPDQFLNDKGRKLKCCLNCRDEAKKYRKNNESYKDNIKEYQKKYNEENKEMIKEQKKKYNEENKEMLNKKKKEYYKKNKEMIKKQVKKYRENNKIKVMVSRHKHLDLKKNRYDANNHIDIPFIEQLIYEQENKCVYCNCEMSMECEYPKPNFLTIERIDNNIGHIKSNCVLACWDCNNKRGKKYSFEEFKEYIAIGSRTME